MTDLLIDPPRNNMPIALMDIDGCVLNIDFRLHHLLNNDYESFLAHWETDKPIPQGVLIYKKLIEDPTIRAVFNTARPETARDVTMKQLRGLFGNSDFELWMCPKEDHQKIDDVSIKLNALKRNGVHSSNVFIAFDDRNCIVEAYRKIGIVAYQTATGY